MNVVKIPVIQDNLPLPLPSLVVVELLVSFGIARVVDVVVSSVKLAPAGTVVAFTLSSWSVVVLEVAPASGDAVPLIGLAVGAPTAVGELVASVVPSSVALDVSLAVGDPVAAVGQ